MTQPPHRHRPLPTTGVAQPTDTPDTPDTPDTDAPIRRREDRGVNGGFCPRCDALHSCDARRCQTCGNTL